MKFLWALILFLPLYCFSNEGEDDIAELEAERAEHAKEIQLIENSVDAMENVPQGAMEEFKKLGHKSLNELNFSDEKVLDIVRGALNESEFSQMPPEIQRRLILEKIQGRPIEKLFNAFPVLLDLIVALFSDKQAIPSLLGIYSRKNDLKKYGFNALAILILGFFLRRYYLPRVSGKFKRFLISLFMTLSINLTIMLVFYFTFTKEVGPSVSVLRKFFKI